MPVAVVATVCMYVAADAVAVTLQVLISFFLFFCPSLLCAMLHLILLLLHALPAAHRERALVILTTCIQNSMVSSSHIQKTHKENRKTK